MTKQNKNDIVIFCLDFVVTKGILLLLWRRGGTLLGILGRGVPPGTPNLELIYSAYILNKQELECFTRTKKIINQ